MTTVPTIKDLRAAAQRIGPYIHRTAVMTSSALDEMTGAKLFFKCENFQRIGAFKMRGATNTVFSLSEQELSRGVATHSSDTTIAVLAGLIIFPTLFHAGLEPGAGGPGMVFVVLTSLLSSIPPAPYGGIVFGTGFFMLLAIAALTSSVSLLEVGTSYLVDEKRMSRKKAAIGLGFVALLLGIPSALANGAVGFLSSLPGIGMDFLSFLFLIFGQYALVIGALLISIFTGWVWGVHHASEEVREYDGKFALRRTWSFLIRFVSPIAITAILVSLVAPLLGF